MKVHYPLHRRVFAGLLLAAACSLPSTLHAQCSLNVSPASLSFTVAKGSTYAAAQLLTITSSGASVSFRVSKTATFLSLSVGGTTPGTVTVSTNAALLAAGTYNTTIQVACLAPNATAVKVPVTLTVVQESAGGKPFVSGFTPLSGLPGTQVQVVGGNFFGILTVTIAGHAAGSKLTSPTSLTATVPGVFQPACGPIQVTNSAGTGRSPDIFAITPFSLEPVICNFLPLSGKAGDKILLRGASFDNVQKVTFNGVNAASFSGRGNFLIATAPAGATTGRIQVTTARGSATSFTDFVITP